MIELELTKGEAILVLELIKHGTDELISQLTDALDEENTSEKMEKAAGENYVVNLEREVERLEEKVASLTAGLEFDEKQDSKWKDAMNVFNLKLDGTPKAKPGPKLGSKHATKRIKKEKV
jgi:hypothetical protein